MGRRGRERRGAHDHVAVDWRGHRDHRRVGCSRRATHGWEALHTSLRKYTRLEKEEVMMADRRCVVGEDVVTVEVVVDENEEGWERRSVVEGGKGGTGAMRERTI